MLKKICVCALALAFSGAVRSSHAAENKMPTPEQMKELRELAAKDVKKQFAAREYAAELLRKVTPIAVTDKDSLSLSGDGLSMLDPRTAGAREFQCQNGLLYCATVRDYNQRYYYFAWDPSHTFAQALPSRR